MESRSRTWFVSSAARDDHQELFQDIEGLNVFWLSRGGHNVFDHAVDEDSPVVALYDRSLVSGASFLAQAAAKLRARGERVANFVVVPYGLYAENIIEGANGNRLIVEAGYAKNKKGDTYVFDQPDKPLAVTMVDVSSIHSQTMHELVEAGIPAIRSRRQFDFDDKWMAKQRMQEFGISTPNAAVYSIDDLRARRATLPERFVLKPRTSFGGMNVYLFKDGMDWERYGQAVQGLGVFYNDAVVEEYQDSITFKDKTIDGPAAFNLRVIAYNGYCGAFARVHPEGQPGNVYSGAGVLSLPKLKQRLRRQHGFDVVKLQEAIEESAYQVSAAFPNAFVGFDAIVDGQGELHVIEVNMSDFGAFNPSAFSKKDWEKSLELTARKISRIAHSYLKAEPVLADGESARCIVDAPERWLHYIWDHMYNPRYWNADEFNAKKFMRNHRELLLNTYQAFEDRRLAGDIQHCQSVFDTIQYLAKAAGHKKLFKLATASLEQLGTHRVDETGGSGL